MPILYSRGVIVTDENPNNITEIRTTSDAPISYNSANETYYKFDSTLAVGSRWVAQAGFFTLPTLTSGSVLLSNGTTIVQDSGLTWNFLFDALNVTGGVGIYQTNTSFPGLKVTHSSDGYPTIQSFNSYNENVFTVTSGGFGNGVVSVYDENGVEKIQLNSTSNSYFTNNLGLGGNTNPSVALDVTGKTKMTYTGATVGTRSLQVSHTGTGGGVGVYITNTGTTTQSNTGVYVGAANSTTANVGLQVNVDLVNSGDLAIECMGSAPSVFGGRIGIGTYTPGTELDVAGQMTIQNRSSTPTILGGYTAGGIACDLSLSTELAITSGQFKLAQQGATNGQALLWNTASSKWLPGTVSSGSGTVTSVAMSVPTGLYIAGSPITTSGTLAVTYTAGYAIPTTAKQTEWDTAYTNRITSLTTTGTSGVSTLTGNTLNIPNYVGGTGSSNHLAIFNGANSVTYNTALQHFSTFLLTGYSNGIHINGANASYASGIKFRNEGYAHCTFGMKGYAFVFSDTSSDASSLWPTPSDKLIINMLNGQLTSAGLTGTGTEMVVASSTGVLSRQAIPGGGSGTVTSVAALTLGTSGTDLSSSVANSTTTPVITLNVPTASAANRGVLSSADWTSFNNKVSNATHTGDATGATALTVVGIRGFSIPALPNDNSFLKFTGNSGSAVWTFDSSTYLTTTGSAAGLTSFPTLNQNTTGSAATLTTGRTISITGDLAYTSPSFNGSGNVTAAGTLATVNANVGTFGSTTQSPVITVDAKGRITAVSNATIAGGGGSGTVTDVSVTTANGISGSVATSTTTPAITLTLGAITPTTVNGLTITSTTGTLTLGSAKTLTVNNSLAFTGTDSTTMTFPTTSATIARTDAAQTFTGVQTMTSPALTTPTITGTPTGTGVATAATASTLVLRDSSANNKSNNNVDNFTTTATAAGTTTLTVGSSKIQEFTGSTTQTVTLPVASTLTTGHAFKIINNSTGNVTVNSSGSNLVYLMGPNSCALVTCILASGTSAASWTTEPIVNPIFGIPFMIGDGVNVLTVGTKVGMYVPFGFTILEWTLGSVNGTSGSVQLDVWVDTHANFAPTVADTITASAKPLFSSTTKGQSSTLTGWTTTIPGDRWVYINVDSVTSITQLSGTLKCRKL